MFVCELQVKSVKTGSVFWTIGCCLSYFYMVRVHYQKHKLFMTLQTLGRKLAKDYFSVFSVWNIQGLCLGGKGGNLAAGADTAGLKIICTKCCSQVDYFTFIIFSLFFFKLDHRFEKPKITKGFYFDLAMARSHSASLKVLLSTCHHYPTAKSISAAITCWLLTWLCDVEM